MKFVCGECQAKYQIPDERVAGRKLKIRCRKCGAAIHLRGEQASAVDEAAPSIEWHVAVDGQQHGPYPTEQMASMLRDGDLGWDASVWRDGYADWKDADGSDTLVRAVASIAETRYGSSQSYPQEARVSSHSIVPEYDEEEPTRMVPSALPDEELPTRMVQGGVPADELPTRMVHNAPMPADELQPHARTAFARQRSVSPTSGVAAVQRAPSVSPASGVAAVQRAPSVSPASGVAPARRPASYAPGALQPAQGRQPSVAPLSSLGPVRVPAPAMSSVAPPAPVPVRTEDLSFAVAKLSATPAPDSMRPGYASGEGSGLIDIRALAALTQAGSSRPAPMQQAGRGRGTTPADVMVPLGAPSSPFGNIDSLAPFERPQRSSSKALPIAIVFGSSVIAAAAFAAVFLTRREAAATPVAVVQPVSAPAIAAAAALPEPAAPSAAAPTEAPAAADAPAAALAAAVEAPAKAEEPAADEPEANEDEAAPSRSGSRVASRSSKSKGNGKAAKSAPAAAKAKTASEKTDTDDLLAAPAEAPAPEKAKEPEKEKPSIDDLLAGNDKPAAAEKPKPPASRSIDELLDGAVDKKGGGSAPAASSAASNLPEAPGRDEVKAAMQGIEGDVKACAAGQTLDAPTATVAVTVTGSSGRVQSVRVTGNQGVVGSCIAKVVRGAKFSPFAKPQFTFNFPYKLK